MIRSAAIENITGHLMALRFYNLNSTSLVYAELAAYNEAFLILEEMLAGILRDAFVQTAEGEALHRFEALVGLPARPDVNAESRRGLIIYRMSVAPRDFTAARMLNSAKAAGIEAEILEDAPNERLWVTSQALIDPTLTIDLARERLESLLPAHLAWELDFGFATADDFDSLGLTWNEIDALDTAWQDADTAITNAINKI
ncbi:MAG: YmfQ family protein [Oscillospiraceae bacterium]|nr:YmfQ family protein [Oscillospiraceae bacterium]